MMSYGKTLFLFILILSVSSSALAGTVIFRYDSMGRLTAGEHPDDSVTFSYAYDRAGNRVTAEVAVTDSDGDGLPDGAENRICTDAYDADTDDDGISDGNEDLNRNGKTGTGETDPCSADTDGDGVQDGTEIGMTAPDTPDTDTDIFIADEDPSSVTDPLEKDCDGDGLPNGYEDTNFNGKYEPELGETDPNSPDTGIWPVLLVTGEEQVSGSAFTESSPFWHTVTAVGCEKQAVAAVGDYSWKFGGYDSFLEIPDSDDFTLGAGDFTIDFRMKSDSNGNLMGHGAWNRDGERGWAVSHTGSRYRNKVCALFSKDGTDGNSISLYVSVAPDNEWHHIAVTRSGSIFMMSADGQTGTSVTYDGALYDSSEVLKIGSSDNWNAAEGYLDQIRIIRGKALTQDEIEDYIQNGQ